MTKHNLRSWKVKFRIAEHWWIFRSNYITWQASIFSSNEFFIIMWLKRLFLLEVGQKIMKSNFKSIFFFIFAKAYFADKIQSYLLSFKFLDILFLSLFCLNHHFTENPRVYLSSVVCILFTFRSNFEGKVKTRTADG